MNSFLFIFFFFFLDGLIDTYKAYCQYYGVPIREVLSLSLSLSSLPFHPSNQQQPTKELVTYVLDLVHSNIHEIDLTSCPGLEREGEKGEVKGGIFFFFFF